MTVSRHGPRIAMVDLLFCWPPKGGADADLYHVVSGLAARGYRTQLFLVHPEGSAARGFLNTESLPFPVEVIEIPRNHFGATAIQAALRHALRTWHPDVVFLMHGYALKPGVALALKEYPLVGRFYAHELLCARDALRFRDGAPCSYDQLRHPETCRRCALRHLAPEIRLARPDAWTMDYLAARAYSPRHHRCMMEALAAYRAIVVSNEGLKRELGRFSEKTVVIPGGITPALLQQRAADTPETARPLRIYMSGRVEDPVKGLSVLLDACERLRRTRRDFEVVITHFDPRQSNEYVKATGWLPYPEAVAWYLRSDICVASSLWREPFGLVAVEAMAAGLPVCASQVGGLQDIVVHGETGLLFPPGDSGALARHLESLLNSPDLRKRMGAAGRERVRTRYTWDHILDTHYLPLIERVIS